MVKKLIFKKVSPVLNFFSRDQSKKTELSKKKLETAKITNENITEIRGQIINQLITIESIIDEIIASYFTNNIQETIKLKRMIISTQLTAFQKWKIIKTIIDTSKHFSKITDKNKFKSDIKEIINIRNEFAHGELLIDINTQEPYLEFYRDGFKKKQINQQSLNEIHEKINKINKTLSKIQIVIFKQYK